jgi:hypothetical protein
MLQPSVICSICASQDDCQCGGQIRRSEEVHLCRVCFNPMHPVCSALKEQNIKICFPCWQETRHNTNDINDDVIVMPRHPPLANTTNTKNVNTNVRFETPAFRPGDFVRRIRRGYVDIKIGDLLFILSQH